MTFQYIPMQAVIKRNAVVDNSAFDPNLSWSFDAN